jgi:hypothetical protein
MKYINFGDLYCVVFHDCETHSAVARAWGMVNSYEKPLSAGFVRRLSDGTFQAEGESISLNLKSNPDVDTRLLNNLLG